MDNFIQTFRHDIFGAIRAIRSYSEPYFFLDDVIRSLHIEDYKISQMTIPSEKVQMNVYISGKEEKISFIDQFGVFSLILDSDISYKMNFYHWFKRILGGLKNCTYDHCTIYAFTFDEMENIKASIHTLSYNRWTEDAIHFYNGYPCTFIANPAIVCPKDHIFSLKDIARMFGTIPDVVTAYSNTYHLTTEDFGNWIDIGNRKRSFFYKPISIPIFEYFFNSSKGYLYSDILGYDFSKQ